MSEPSVCPDCGASIGIPRPSGLVSAVACGCAPLSPSRALQGPPAADRLDPEAAVRMIEDALQQLRARTRLPTGAILSVDLHPELEDLIAERFASELSDWLQMEQDIPCPYCGAAALESCRSEFCPMDPTDDSIDGSPIIPERAIDEPEVRVWLAMELLPRLWRLWNG